MQYILYIFQMLALGVTLGAQWFALGVQWFALGAQGFLDINMLV